MKSWGWLLRHNWKELLGLSYLPLQPRLPQDSISPPPSSPPPLPLPLLLHSPLPVESEEGSIAFISLLCQPLTVSIGKIKSPFFRVQSLIYFSRLKRYQWHVDKTSNKNWKVFLAFGSPSPVPVPTKNGWLFGDSLNLLQIKRQNSQKTKRLNS